MPDHPENLKTGSTPIELFVWVDPELPIAAHNLNFTGQFLSAGQLGHRQVLPFLPNPDFKDVFVSPFCLGIMRPYIVEYNLELARQDRFQLYPSRLGAIFLLPSRAEAEKYRKRHPEHVAKRTLMVARTIGPYKYSEHDSSWIDFLRRDHSLDEGMNAYADCYWQGVNADRCNLESLGKPWSQAPIREVLYEGAIEFPDRTIPQTEPTMETSSVQSTRK